MHFLAHEPEEASSITTCVYVPVINAEFCSHGSEKLRLLTTSFRKDHLLRFQEMYPQERVYVAPHHERLLCSRPLTLPNRGWPRVLLRRILPTPHWLLLRIQQIITSTPRHCRGLLRRYKRKRSPARPKPPHPTVRRESGIAVGCSYELSS